MTSTYDAVIIGGGHNGLTCAAYLAKAGAQVLVLEGEDKLGGGARTEELTVPGMRHNSCANFFIGFDASPLPLELELDRHGFEFQHPEVQQAFLSRDENALVLYSDVERSVESMGRHSPADARMFRELCDRYEALRPIMVSALHNTPSDAAAIRATLTDEQQGELKALATEMPYDIVARHFETEHLKVLLQKLFHVVQGTNSIGMGTLFPSLFLNLRNMCLPVGGTQTFTEALASVVRSHGGEIATGARVERILLDGGTARGVVLEDGSDISAHGCVISAIDFPQTVDLLSTQFTDADVLQKAASWDWTSAWSLVTLHLALREPPAYHAAEHQPDVGSAFNITFGVDTTEELVRSLDDLRNGAFPSLPAGNGSCNSLFDGSYSPEGGYSAFWWPFASYSVDGAPDNWDRRRDEYQERLLQEWRRYAANVSDDNLLGSALRTPLDVERDDPSMRCGSVRMGPYTSDQFGPNRPHSSWADYRVAGVEGLYHCSSTSPNGGGLNGAPGYAAAGVIVDDLGYDRWWPRMTVERAQELC